MSTSENDLELNERLSLIESMIAEGRRGTESWGWTFVLWGVAYYIAIAWSVWGHGNLAWPVTMIAASVVTAVAGTRLRRGRPGTTLGRATAAVWIGMGIALFVVLMSLSIAGRYETHVFMAVIGAMLGAANITSSIILKWRMQFACAVVWLALAVAACFGSELQVSVAFLAAIFFCQIVFGVYAMVRDARRRGRQGAVHA